MSARSRASIWECTRRGAANEPPPSARCEPSRVVHHRHEGPARVLVRRARPAAEGAVLDARREGAYHGFVELAARQLRRLRADAREQQDIEFGREPRRNGPAATSAPGTMQHVAFHVDSLEEILAMRDRLRTRGRPGARADRPRVHPVDLLRRAGGLEPRDLLRHRHRWRSLDRPGSRRLVWHHRSRARSAEGASRVRADRGTRAAADASASEQCPRRRASCVAHPSHGPHRRAKCGSG